MAFFRSAALISLITLTLFAAQTHADTWQDDRYKMSMQVPEDWLPMRETLLAQTNAQVSHLTGRGFIAGYATAETDTLVFPYILVQFKPYSALPAQVRPTAKLDERGQLELLYALVSAFREKGPLPQTIDTPQFIDQFGNNHARLIRLEADGRFDFTGKIPHEKDQVPILYHTHGILGKDGIALVSVFTVDNFTGVNSVIQEQMRTLGFAKGQGIDALPDEPPAPEPEPVTPEPIAEPEPEPKPQPVPAAPIEPASPAEPTAGAEPTETDEAEANASVDNPGDSTALILI